MRELVSERGGSLATRAKRALALATLLALAPLVAGSAGAGEGAREERAPRATPAAEDELASFLPESGGSSANETSCSIDCILSSCSVSCRNASAICRCDIVALVVLGAPSNEIGEAECRCVNATWT